jgi:hypothetical protein
MGVGPVEYLTQAKAAMAITTRMTITAVIGETFFCIPVSSLLQRADAHQGRYILPHAVAKTYRGPEPWVCGDGMAVAQECAW